MFGLEVLFNADNCVLFQLCEEFFTEGAAGRCPERDTCCGLLNATTKYFHIDIYCCHDTEK